MQKIVDDLSALQRDAEQTLLKFAKIIMSLRNKNPASKEDLEIIKDVEFLCQVATRQLSKNERSNPMSTTTDYEVEKMDRRIFCEACSEELCDEEASDAERAQFFVSKLCSRCAAIELEEAEAAAAVCRAEEDYDENAAIEAQTERLAMECKGCGEHVEDCMCCRSCHQHPEDCECGSVL